LPRAPATSWEKQYQSEEKNRTIMRRKKSIQQKKTHKKTKEGKREIARAKQDKKELEKEGEGSYKGLGNRGNS